MRAQLCGQCAGGVGEGGEVQGAVLAERCGRAEDRGTDPAEGGGVGGGAEAGGEQAAEFGGGQRPVGAGEGGDVRVGVVADGADTGGGGGLGEGRPR